MNDLDLLTTYRKIYGSLDDGLSCWWYFGGVFIDIPGQPSIPVIQAETVMVYRLQTIGADAFHMHWWEIGYFRDIATGEIAKTWTNPVSGAQVAAPGKFEEGPARFTFTRHGDGLHVDLIQPGANVQSVDVKLTTLGERVHLLQTEKKVRGFPQADGTLPDPASAQSSAATSILSVFADRAALGSEARSVESSGAYSFELQAPAGWMAFGDVTGKSIVRGVMQKAPLNHQLNPTAWARLKQTYPHYFDGDRILPLI